MAFAWTDASRDEVLIGDASDKREFSVSVWYPADAVSAPASPYLPDVELWSSTMGEPRLRETLGGAWDAVKSSKDLAHDRAPIAKGRQRFPLLVFLPGLGMITRVYSALVADLASHGYVIVAVDPTYEVFATTLRDGRVAGFASPEWFRPPVENIVRHERGRLLVWAADARFALDQLRGQPLFDRRVDWSNVGALGHSAGARVAAHLCQTVRNVKACLNLDGFAGFEPFFAEPASTFDKHFAMIHAVIPDPTDAQLKSMGWTWEEMLIEKARQRCVGIRLFESVRPGSLEVTLNPSGMGHGSFTDLPLLGNGPPGDHRRAMELIRVFSRAFFDRALKRLDEPRLESLAADGDVELTPYVHKGPTPKR